MDRRRAREETQSHRESKSKVIEPKTCCCRQSGRIKPVYGQWNEREKKVITKWKIGLRVEWVHEYMCVFVFTAAALQQIEVRREYH